MAQLDRASDFGSDGWGFESLRARENPIRVKNGMIIQQVVKNPWISPIICLLVLCSCGSSNNSVAVLGEPVERIVPATTVESTKTPVKKIESEENDVSEQEEQDSSSAPEEIEQAPIILPGGKNVIVGVQGVLGWSENGEWIGIGGGPVPAATGDLYQVIRIGNEAISGVLGADPQPYCTQNSTIDRTIAIDDPLFTSFASLSMPYTEPVTTPIAISTDWDLTPNKVVSLGLDSIAIKDIAQGLLSEFDIDDPDPELTILVETDLDGDGNDEIFFGVERIADSLMFNTVYDYSLLYMRKVIDGRFTNVLIYGDIENAEYGNGMLNSIRLSAVADLNGDGRMEVVIGLMYYEGSSTFVIEFNDDKESFTQVLYVGCNN